MRKDFENTEKTNDVECKIDASLTKLSENLPPLKPNSAVV